MGGNCPVCPGPELTERGRRIRSPLEMDIYLLLPSDITFLVFRPVDSDWDSHHWLRWFSRLWVWTNYPTGFPEPLVFRWQTVGLLGLKNCVSQFLIINFFLCNYLYLPISINPSPSPSPLSYWFCFSGETWLINLLSDDEPPMYLKGSLFKILESESWERDQVYCEV